MKRGNWLGATSGNRLETLRVVETFLQSKTAEGKVVVTDASGALGSSVVTVAELGHLANITSNVQTQITGTRENVYGTPVNTTITLGDANYTTVKSALVSIYRKDAP